MNLISKVKSVFKSPEVPLTVQTNQIKIWCLSESRLYRTSARARVTFLTYRVIKQKQTNEKKPTTKKSFLAWVRSKVCWITLAGEDILLRKLCTWYGCNFNIDSQSIFQMHYLFLWMYRKCLLCFSDFEAIAMIHFKAAVSGLHILFYKTGYMHWRNPVSHSPLSKATSPWCQSNFVSRSELLLWI